MPALDQYLRDQSVYLAEQQTKDAEAIEREQKAHAAEAYAKLDALIRNPEFAWFTETFLRPIVDTARENALDIKKHVEERNNHCQQYAMANSILELAISKRLFFKQQAGFGDD